jgi:ABC-type sugar transport system substrate-binding protein
MKKNVKRVFAALTVSVLLLSLAVACNSGTPSPAQGQISSNSTPASNEQDQLFIGLAMHNQTEDWAVQFANTFRAESEAVGAKVAVTDANSTAANQVSQIEDLVAQGIDVLVVLPADYTALGNALKDAKDKGVKIVNADSKVDEGDQALVDCFVTADCYSGGYNAGLYLAEALPENAVLGELNYPQLSVIAVRFEGMRAALADKGRSDVTIVSKDCTDLSAIATYTEDMLIANPEIDGFLCLNDNTALTCAGTCKQMDKKDVIIIGFDGSPAGKQSIAAGEMTGSMVYSPVDLAKTSCEAALKLAKNESVDKETMVEMWMINPGNIGEQDLDNWT